MGSRPEASTIAVRVASGGDARHAGGISRAIGREIREGAVGMARRPVGLIREKMASGDALIALDTAGGAWVGFAYISPWEGGKFVSTSALIVRKSCRRLGVAMRLKESALELCRARYPQATPFGLTTSEAVRRINRALGFVEVPYGEIPRDPEFWRGCETCPFCEELRRNEGRACRCTAMARKRV